MKGAVASELGLTAAEVVGLPKGKSCLGETRSRPLRHVALGPPGEPQVLSANDSEGKQV